MMSSNKMLKKIMSVALLTVSCVVYAALINNPDPDTLWVETGKNMKFGPNNYCGDWCCDKTKVTETDNGFIVEAIDGRKGGFGIYAPISREYPYLEYEMEVIEQGQNANLWFPWVVNLGPLYQHGPNIRSGYYVVNIWENTEKLDNTKAGKVFIGMNLFNVKVCIRSLRMTKNPRFKFDVKPNSSKTWKCVMEQAVVEFQLSSNKEKLPDNAKTYFEDVSTSTALDFNEEPYLSLGHQTGYPDCLSASPEIRTLSRKNLGAGLVKIRVDGLSTPVMTWLAYPWVAPGFSSKKSALPQDMSWVKDIRPDHPRIFINKDTLPKVRQWAQKIGMKQLLADADNFQLDPQKTRIARGNVGDKRPYSQVNVVVPVAWENEALVCALAYLLTDEQKYAEKSWTFLKHNLMAYQECAKKRTALGWWGLMRIQNMTAFDWIWNTLPENDRKQYLKDFIDVNIQYARHGWYGPFNGVNGGGGYGDSNTELFMGVLAYNEGVCDELALDMLEKGYVRYRFEMDKREQIAEDDGILTTTAMGYSVGQVPWLSYDFLALWRTMFKQKIQLPKFDHLLYFGEWFQWNMLPGKGIARIREFGLGDNAKTNMIMFSISEHLYYIMSLYADSYPEEAAELARAIKWMEKKYDPEYYYEKGKIYQRTVAPQYHWGFFRGYLAYDFEKINADSVVDSDSKVMARHFPVGGLLYMRSGKKEDSTYAQFNVGSVLISHKTRGDENHFSIFHKGYLAIDSGYREDTLPAPVKYHNSSIAHNTILIHDPSEKFIEDADRYKSVLKTFGYCWESCPDMAGLIEKQMPYIEDAQGGQDKNLGGKCLAFSTSPDYTYIAGDATAVYSAKKCAEFTRQFIHLQPDVFVVFDRVESKDPSFKKEWLLHFLEEPTIDGKVTTAHVSDEGGVIRCHSLLPKNGIVTRIGGPGKEFMGTNVSWEGPKKHMDKVKYGGAWRISLSPAEPNKRDYFLNVLDVGDKPVKQVSSSEDEQTATVYITLADGRKAEITFNKNGRPGGQVRIDGMAGTPVNEKLTQKVAPQSGFLF